MTDQSFVDPGKVQLLEDSFAKLSLHSETFALHFYENLFAANPEFRPLFSRIRADEQESKLFKALMLAAQNLRKPDLVRSHFVVLGLRHAGKYHVPTEAYSKFVATLLQTLAEYAGDEWTPGLADAWSEALTRLAEIMQSAGAPL